MFQNPIRRSLALFALAGAVATAGVATTAANDVPRLFVKDPEGRRIVEYVVAPACPPEETSAADGCALWIGDGKSAPSLVGSPGEPAPGIVTLSPPGEITATLRGLPKSVEADDLVVRARWMPAEGASEWLDLPARLLRLDLNSLPKVVLKGLPGGLVEIEIDAGEETYRFPRALLETGGWSDLGNLTRVERHVVCGRVRGLGGESEGVEVYWGHADRDLREATNAPLLAGGRFCLPELGDEVVWVWAEGAGWSSEPVQVSASDFRDRDLDLSVSRNERLLVSWATPGVSQVELELNGELTVGSRTHLTRLARSTVARGGSIELPRHRPLVVVAHARRESDPLAPELLRIEGAETSGELLREAVFDFQPSSRFEGTVTTAPEEPLEGVTLTAWLTTPASEVPFRIQSAQTDPDGRFVLTGLPPGRYELVARRRGFLDGRRTSELGTEDVRDLDLTLSRGGRVSGTVVERGAPVSGAHVQLIGHGIRSTWTAADGRFDFEGVPLGASSIQVDVPGRRQAHERVTLADGLPAEVRIELAAGTRWRTRVVGFSGTPSRITLLRASERYTAPVAADGRFVLENGPDGLVGFALTAADGSLLCTGGAEVPRGVALMSSDIPCRSGAVRGSEGGER